MYHWFFLSDRWLYKLRLSCTSTSRTKRFMFCKDYYPNLKLFFTFSGDSNFVFNHVLEFFCHGYFKLLHLKEGRQRTWQACETSRRCSVAAYVPSWTPSKLVYVHGTEVLPSSKFPSQPYKQTEKRWLSLEARISRVLSPDQRLLPLQRYITTLACPFTCPSRLSLSASRNPVQTISVAKHELFSCEGWMVCSA